MYEHHYRFRRQPFSPTPDPECFYKSDAHQRALEQLLWGIRRRTVVPAFAIGLFVAFIPLPGHALIGLLHPIPSAVDLSAALRRFRIHSEDSILDDRIVPRSY